MNYEETLSFLYNSLPMFQRSGKPAYKAGLDNTIALDKFMSHPHRNYKSIHIAGTNGKGSVSHILASILQEAGYKTGLYTSPHLIDFRERIKINGKMIPKQDVIELVDGLKGSIATIKPSFFEMTAAMAFEHFSRERTDIAVIETGMGGRLDSTNIVQPEISVITNISFDHTDFLGNTIAQIAAEKAGIIKRDVPVICGKITESAMEVISKAASKNQSPIIKSQDIRKYTYQTILSTGKTIFHFENLRHGNHEGYTSDLVGYYQAENINTSLTALSALQKKGFNIPQEAITAGLENVKTNTGLRGRWEILGANPRIIADTAHNEAGVAIVAEQLNQLATKSLHIIWGMVGDKPSDHLLPLLPREAQYYLVEPSIPRAMPLTQLIYSAKKMRLNYKSFSSVFNGFEAAMKKADPEDTIFIGGSTFVVADLLSEFESPDFQG